jgi:hypothetical protein
VREKVFAVAQAQRSPARTSPPRAPSWWQHHWYVELGLVAVLLWGLDAVTRFRGNVAAVGLANAQDVRAISRDMGGGVTQIMNHWLAPHPQLAIASAIYYIVLHGLVTGIAGIALLRTRPPRFALHRNALILTSAIALATFWLYPVAPPRMLPGFHDTAAATVPFFAEMLEGKAADEFASLPSLHVAWAIWVAIAAQAILRRPVWRVLVWVYPALTIADVLATANHYLLDIVAAPIVVALGYGVAVLGELAVGLLRRRAPDRRARASEICWTSAPRAQPAAAPQGRARCPAIPRLSQEDRLRQLARHATEARNRRPVPSGGHQQAHRLAAGGRQAPGRNMPLWACCYVP